MDAIIARLESLPAELFEEVNSYLDLEDLRSLRLVSKDIEAKASQNKFKEYFCSHTVYWTSFDQLQTLKWIVSPQSGLGLALEHLTLAAHPKRHDVIDAHGGLQSLNGFQNSATCHSENASGTAIRLPWLTPDTAEMCPPGSDPFASFASECRVCISSENLVLRVLKNVFENIKAHSKYGRLRTLTLDVHNTGYENLSPLASYDEHSAASELNYARYTFRYAVQSLSSAGLEVDKLDFFAKDATRCRTSRWEQALSLDYVSHALHDRVLESPLRTLNNLSMRLVFDTPSIEGRNTLIRLLQLCPNLSSLKLFSHGANELYRQGKFIRLSPVKLPSMQNVHITDMTCDATDLTAWLRELPDLRSVILHRVTICRGTFQPMFDYLTNHPGRLEQLHFFGLREYERVVNFGERAHEIGHDPEQSRFGGIFRRGEDIRKPIRYDFENEHNVAYGRESLFICAFPAYTEPPFYGNPSSNGRLAGGLTRLGAIRAGRRNWNSSTASATRSR